MSQVYFVTSLLIQQRGWDRETRYLQEAMEKRNIQSQLVPFDDPQIIWDKADLSIIRTPHDYWLDVPKFLKWTRQVEKQTTLWNQSQVIQWNSSKIYLIKLQEAKVPVPPTIHIKQGSNEKG